MDETHVISSLVPQNLHSRRKVLIILCIVLALVSAMVFILVFFPSLIFKDPKQVIYDSINKLTKSDSFSFEAQLFGLDDLGRLKLSGSFIKSQESYSKLKFDFVTTTPDSPEKTILLDLVFNKDEVYLKPFYSGFIEFENQVLLEIPEIGKSETYKVIRPILLEEKWVLFKDTGESSEATKLLKERYQNLIQEKDITKLATKFKETIIIKSFDKNFEQNGIDVYKIVAGFDKSKLSEFIDEIGNSIRNDLSKLYAKEIKDAVDSLNWNQNLLEILVDKKTGNLFSVDISLPDLNAVEESSSTFYGALTDEYLRAQLEKELRNNQSLPLVRVINIRFSDFDKVSKIDKPNDFVDWADLWKVIEKELGVYLDSIGGLLGAINPTKQFAQARDTKRRADLYAISNAVYQFAAEHGGRLPDTDNNDATSNFPKIQKCIGTSPNCFNLANAGWENGDTVVPTYIMQMPYDPSGGTLFDTNYSIYADSAGRIVISAKGETTPVISVTR